MPKLTFTFSGYVRGASIDSVLDASADKKIDVSTWPAARLARALNNGEVMISLGDHLYENDDAEIDIFDFEETQD